MSDQPEPATTTAVAVQPPRQVRIVESPVAILDTAKFEHMGRVATIMAQAGLLPDTLTRVDGNPTGPFLDFETIRARAFMIVNQATTWNMDPQAVAQATSLVYNRLMYEGKLVSAAIQHTLGIEFDFKFGGWDLKANEFTWEKLGEGDLLAVHVTAHQDGKLITDLDGTPKSIEGHVGGWKTTKNGSPWTAPAGHRRMLRNRGIREWTRAYKPAVILGVYTPDDNFDDDEAPARIAGPKTSRKRDLTAKLTGPQAEAAGEAEGFNASGIGEALANAAPPAREGETDEHDADGVVKEPATGWVVLADVDGPAPMGEIYLLAGDEPKDDRLATYRDGVSFSTCKADKAATLTRYTAHAAPAHDAEVVDGAADMSGASDAQDDDDGDWMPLESNAGAAPRGVEYTLADDEVGADELVQAYEDGEPTRRVDFPTFKTLPEYEAHPEPLVEAGDEPSLIGELARETSWLPIKARLPKIYADPDFAALTVPDQKAVRSAIWEVVLALKKKHRDPVDHAEDPSAFRLWCDTQKGPDGADAIEGTFRTLKRAAPFKGMAAAQQEKLEAVVQSICMDLRGA